MTVIVTDAGFSHEEPAALAGDAVTLDDLENGVAAETVALALDNDVDAAAVASHFHRVALITIPFPSFADGRGFSLAKRLREAGYDGRLRATGHVIADQYAHARRVGFDEVEISDDLALRQPEEQWLARIGWQDHFYQKRLQAVA